MANVRHLSLNDCNLPGFTSTGAWSPMLWSRYTQTSCQHSRSQTLPNLSRWISPPDTHLRSTALTTAPPVLTAAPPMLATALRHSPPLHQCSSPLCDTHHRSINVHHRSATLTTAPHRRYSPYSPRTPLLRSGSVSSFSSPYSHLPRHC